MIAAILQTNLIWENPSENRKLIENQLQEVNELVDLIVLPEMFTSGFSMNPERVAETMEGETISWLKRLAKEKDSAITGSLIITENGNYYNRLVFVFPDGRIEHYDKRHLFTLAGEDKVYSKGNEKLIVEFRGFKICLLICYDLRFPVFARNVEDYDLLIYVANWPKTRIQAWDILLRARAVENMSYAIGVNRIGNDANGMEYVGHSQAVDFLGDYLIEPQKKDGLFVAYFDTVKLLETRNRLGFLNDKDDFSIIR